MCSQEEGGWELNETTAKSVALFKYILSTIGTIYLYLSLSSDHYLPNASAQTGISPAKRYSFSIFSTEQM
jgi:hypothetical protein